MRLAAADALPARAPDATCTSLWPRPEHLATDALPARAADAARMSRAPCPEHLAAAERRAAPRLRLAALAACLLAAAAPRPASARPDPAAPLADPAQRSGVAWRPVAVTTIPLERGEPWAAPTAGPKARPVTVDPTTAALVRAAPLTTLRVRAEAPAGGPPPPLRLWRRAAGPDPGAPATATSRAAISEPALEVSPGTWLIEQPPGGPGEWLISAARPARIIVEAPAPRHAELIWDHVAGAVLAWIDRGGAPPPLPDLPAAALLRRELLADAAIAAALAQTDPRDMPLRRAVQAWRRAAALQRLAALRPADRPTFALDPRPRDLPGTTPVRLERARWRRAAGPQTWELRLTGPGALWIDARHFGQDPKASLSVTAAGRRLGRVDLQPAARAAAASGPATAAGPPRRLAVPLAPGAHTYRLRLDGDVALLQVRAGRTSERLEVALRRERLVDHLRAAHRALARSSSPRAPLVAALLALVDGRPLPTLPRPDGPPALALLHTWLMAQVDDPAPARRRALARALADAADAIDDPALADRARAAALDLVSGTADADLVRRLAGPRPAEAPAPTLGRLALLLDGPALPGASPAIALLEQARAAAPHDPALRAAYREHWQEATRWAPLHADDGAGPPLQWIEPLPPDPTRPPTRASLWTWPSGPARKFLSPTLAAAPSRPALLRLYTDLPAGTGSLALAVDGRRWRTLPLAARERIAVAVPPGAHALAVTAPTGARVWSSLPPDPATAPDARLLRMWPLAPAAPLRFVLPGRPSFARVEVRAVDAAAPSRVHLTVRTDTGSPRALALDLRPADDAAIGLDGAPRLGPPASLIVPLDPAARALEIVAPDGGPRLAVTASIRAPGARDAPVPGDTSVPPSPVPPDSLAAGPAATAGAAPPDPPDTHAAALLAVERTSRDLRARPDDPALRLARAEALLDLGQRSLALTDWSRLVAGPLPPALQGRAAVFAARLDELAAPTHLDLVTDGPALVAPALAAADLDDDALAQLAPIAALARERGPAAALEALAAAPRLPPGPARPAPVPRSAAEALARPRDMSLTTSPLAPAPRSAAEALARPRDMSPGPSSAAAGAMSVAWSLSGGTRRTVAVTAERAAPSAPTSLEIETAGSAHVPTDMSLAARPLGPAAEALRASLLDAAARPDEAARAWTRVYAATGRWQHGLAGVHSALAALDEPATAPGGAGLAYGLALQLGPTVRTPALDRLTAIAGERSRWSRLILAERGSNPELRDLPPRAGPPTPRASVRAALLAPPWPLARAAVLRPGAAATIDLERGGAALTFDLWCQVARPDLGGGAATVRIFVGEELLAERPVPPDSPEVATVEVPRTDSVTVTLDAADRGHLCAARLREDHARTAAPPARWHVARAGRPIEFALLGPATLEIEARAQRPGEARRLELSLSRGDAGGFAPRAALDLPVAPDPAAASSDLPSRTSSPGLPATRVLTLAEAGPLRVRLAPDAGAALVRLRQRLDDAPAAAPPRPPARPDALAGGAAVDLASGVRPPPRLPPDPRPAQRIGTPYAGLHFGTDDLEEADDLRVRVSGVVRLGFARELVAHRLWIAAEPELRPREGTALVAGGRLSLQAAFPRAGVRARLSGLGLAQADPSRPWSLRGDLRVDRPTWIAPRLQLLPGLEVSARHQSLSDVPQDQRADLHPRVYQFYLDRHPLALRPTLDLRLALWQDARAVVGADVVPNSDLRSLDQVNAHVGLAAVPVLLGRVVPDVVLDYEASLRLQDADRAQTYVRHRILVGLGVAFWIRDRARLSFGARDSLYLSAPFPVRNGLDVWLRVDLPFGRGLSDQGPFDLSFRAAREHRLWR